MHWRTLLETQRTTVKKQYRVTWFAYPRQDYPQFSGILSGLAANAKNGVIDLTVVMTDRWTPHVQAMMELEVDHLPSGRKRNIAIDFFDVESRIDNSSLQWCDIYYKRQFGPATVTAAPESQAAKLRPLGLTIAAFSPSSWAPSFQAIFKSIGTKCSNTQNASLWQQFVAALQNLRQWAALADVDSVTARDTDVRLPNIVFQPRLWDTMPGCGDDFDVANRDRIETVINLRRRFPNFVASIGLVPSQFAYTHAPQEVLSPAVRTREYHKQLRQSDIAVNCVGLSGSVGWKFAEYMAAGNANKLPLSSSGPRRR
jgi:hypothetical protein